MRAITMRYVRRGARIVKRLALRNPVRKWRIRRTQDRLLKADFNPSAERLIIILTPGADIVNGGILSIASIFAETQKLRDLHQSEVLICTIPGDPLLLKYTKFKNDNHLFEFSRILSHFMNSKELMIHIPEYCIEQFLMNLSSEDCRNLKKIRTVRINIMLQNIRFLSDFKLLVTLRGLGNVTCTTAHEQYTSQETRRDLGVPLHKLSVWGSPELYERRPYSRKQNLMIVSPDSNPHRREVMREISRGIPTMEIITISNMPYEEYIDTIAKAKWSLTFGEGLDGYFVETIFSGGVGIAVYNPDFFTPDFQKLRTVYRNYDELRSRICSDIVRLDKTTEFVQYQGEQHDLCAKYYNHAQYLENLRLFYERRYTYP